jgi:hypothetical protein
MEAIGPDQRAIDFGRRYGWINYPPPHVLRFIAEVPAEDEMITESEPPNTFRPHQGLENLAPEIQERLLFLPGPPSERDAVTEREMRRECDEAAWERQRRVIGFISP